jgi:hypothetical protein
VTLLNNQTGLLTPSYFFPTPRPPVFAEQKTRKNDEGGRGGGGEGEENNGGEIHAMNLCVRVI